MKRWFVGLIVLAVIGAISIWRAAVVLRQIAPIRVGLLHSETGDLAISEKSLIEAEQLAIEQIDARGGLLGRRVEGVVADGRSDWPTFAREARRLIEMEKVSVIFGCWSSASRKSVKPIVEQYNHLLLLVAFGVAEEELRSFPLREMVSDYAAWNYFQSLDRPENQEFVKTFKAKYGEDRVVSDTIAMAYNSVMLWAQAVEEGETADVARVRKLILHQSFNAPGGIISIDAATQHTWRPVYIGRICSDGQFAITWTSDAPVRPIPYPGSRTRDQWETFVHDLFRRWGGNWVNPFTKGLAIDRTPG